MRRTASCAERFDFSLDARSRWWAILAWRCGAGRRLLAGRLGRRVGGASRRGQPGAVPTALAASTSRWRRAPSPRPELQAHQALTDRPPIDQGDAARAPGGDRGRRPRREPSPRRRWLGYQRRPGRRSARGLAPACAPGARAARAAGRRQPRPLRRRPAPKPRRAAPAPARSPVAASRPAPAPAPLRPARRAATPSRSPPSPRRGDAERLAGQALRPPAAHRGGRRPGQGALVPRPARELPRLPRVGRRHLKDLERSTGIQGVVIASAN